MWNNKQLLITQMTNKNTICKCGFLLLPFGTKISKHIYNKEGVGYLLLYYISTYSMQIHLSHRGNINHVNQKYYYQMIGS